MTPASSPARRPDLKTGSPSEGTAAPTRTSRWCCGTRPRGRWKSRSFRESPDSRWFFAPDHAHAVLQPGEDRSFLIHADRMGDSLDQSFQLPVVRVERDYLAEGARIALPAMRAQMPLSIDLPRPTISRSEHALAVNGRQAVRVDDHLFDVPDGPLTLECWFNARSFGDLTGLITKTENSEYGIFLNRGVPSFSVFLGDRYAEVQARDATLNADAWHHIAGVYDGGEVRLYLDGALVGSAARSGTRRQNDLPLLLGADVDGHGNPTSFFDGAIDSVRLSKIARYSGDRFEPARRFESDDHTVLLYNMDRAAVPWLYDESPSAAHVQWSGRGEVRVVR